MKRALLALPVLVFVGCSIVVDVDRFNSDESSGVSDATTQQPDTALDTSVAESAINDTSVAESAIDSAIDSGIEAPPTRPPQVFIAGGNTSGTNLTTVLRGEIIGGAIPAWAEVTNRLSASASSTQATRSGRHVFILGPDFVTSNTHTVRFASFDSDGKLSAWSGQKAAFTPHNRVAAASNAKFVYALGGQDSTSTAMPSVYVAPINTDGSPGVFTTTRSMPTGRSGTCATVVDGNLYVFGGDTGTSTDLRSTLRGVIATDGAISEWRPQTDLTVTTVGCSAVSFGKKVFVLGGYGAQDVVQYATVGSSGELGPFATGAKMLSQHAFYQAVVAGGYVVVAGGFAGPSGSSDKVEIAPISESGIGTWSSTTSLPAPRIFLNAFGFD